MDYRVFNGKRYNWWDEAKTSYRAEAKAKVYRKQGYLVRIAYEADGKYHIYTKPRKNR